MPFTLCLALSFCGLDQPKAPVKPVFKMDRSTTFITEPLTADGYPDYEYALNKHLRGNLKPDDNACVRLWDAIGPKPAEWSKGMPKEYWTWLGRNEPVERGSHFQHFYIYDRKSWLSANPGQKNADYDRISEERNNHHFSLHTRPWTEKDAPVLAEWLKSQDENLKIVSDACRRRGYYSPLIPREKDSSIITMQEVLLPHTSAYRDVLSALTIRSMKHLGDGRVQMAWDDILTLHRFGRHLQYGGSLIEFLLGVSVESIAIQRTIDFLKYAQPSTEMCRKLQKDLDALPERSPFAGKVEWAERMALLDAACWVRRRGTSFLENLSRTEDQKEEPKNIMLDRMDWTITLRELNSSCDQLVSILKIKTYSERKKAWQKYNAENAKMKNELIKQRDRLEADLGKGDLNEFVAKWIGQSIVALLLSAIEKVDDAETRLKQAHENVRIAIALKAHHAETETFPAKLDDLAPKYLKTIPVDLFNNKPLHYERTAEGYLLASVGGNGTLEKKLLGEESDERSPDDVGIRWGKK